MNKATPEEMKIIQGYLEKISKKESPSPILETVDADFYTFYSPIIIQAPLCLNCHGEPGINIKNEDYIAIHLVYPQDSAIGFNMGDLRGMWMLKFPREKLLQ